MADCMTYPVIVAVQKPRKSDNEPIKLLDWKRLMEMVDLPIVSWVRKDTIPDEE